MLVEKCDEMWYTYVKARLNTIENHMGATEAAP